MAKLPTKQEDLTPVALAEISADHAPELDCDTRKRVSAFLISIASGEKHRTALATNNFSWSQFRNMRFKNRYIDMLYEFAYKLGDEVHQLIREEEADRRAIEGVKEPIHYKGKKISEVTKYSDQLLALQLRAGNPEKYGDHTGGGAGTVLQVNLDIHRDPQVPENSIPATAKVINIERNPKQKETSNEE